MPSVFKGLFISVILFLVIIIFLYMRGVKEMWELGALVFLIPAFPIIGLILGYAGTKIQTKRFRKLFPLGLLLIYLTAIILSFAIILMDDSKILKGTEIFYSVFMLGTTGFFIFGTALLPLLLLGVYFLERWTRTI